MTDVWLASDVPATARRSLQGRLTLLVVEG